ncbi:MAG: hypothetical protein ABIT04_11675 [Novosphingobium sp.]
MGGYRSGRQGGRPTAGASRRIDLPWMFRTGRAKEGLVTCGSLHWSCGDQPAGSISYKSLMDEPGAERLVLSYTRGAGNDRESVEQVIRLCCTVPHYGGKRWWMICPYQHVRASKLYLPEGGDRFASRQAWRLGYQCQRLAHRDRAFEAMFRLQKKLGCYEGYEAGLHRPKGMWNRTFERHWQRYWRLDRVCAVEMMLMLGRLRSLEAGYK